MNIDELLKAIEDIRRRHDVSDTVAIIQLLTERGLIGLAADIVDEILLKQNILRIPRLEAGMRNVCIFGRVELVKFFEKSGGKYWGLFVITDGLGRAYIYVPAKIKNTGILETITVGDIIIIKGADVSGRLKNRAHRVILREDATIRKVSEDYAARTIGRIPPPIRVLDVSDITGSTISENELIQVSGIVMSISESMASKNYGGNGSRKYVRLLIGSMRDFCKSRIPCLLFGEAVEVFKKSGIGPGDAIILRGVNIRIRGDRKYIVGGNLVVMEKQECPHTPPSSISDGGWWVFRLRAVSSPRIGTYTRDGLEHRYLTLLGSVNSEMVRLIVWNENMVDELSGIVSGSILDVFGQIRTGRDRREIHVHQNMGSVRIVRLGRVELRRPVMETPTTICRIENLSVNTYVNVILRIEEVHEIRSGNLVGVCVLSDGLRRIRMLIWDEKLLSNIKKYGCGWLVKIGNVRVVPDRSGRDKIVLSVTNKTSVEPIARNFDYWFDEEGVVSEPLSVIAETTVGDRVAIVGHVIRTEWIGLMHLCKKCGAFIVDPEEGICELGHVGEAISRKIVAVLLDDGFSSISVMIPYNILQEYTVANGSINVCGAKLRLYGVLRVDYSSGAPAKVFVAEKVGIGKYVEHLLGWLTRILRG